MVGASGVREKLPVPEGGVKRAAAVSAFRPLLRPQGERTLVRLATPTRRAPVPLALAMRRLRVLPLLLGAVLVPLGSRSLPAQDLLTYAFSFSARAIVFGNVETTNFTWSATRPVADTYCQTPNSITSCWQAVTNSTMSIEGVGTYGVSNLLRLRSKSYANQGVGGVSLTTTDGSTFFEIWNDQLLGHNLGGPLSPLPFVGQCGGNGGVTTIDCVWQLPPGNLSLLAIETSGGEVRLLDLISASYAVSVVPGGTDPETGEGLPPVDPDPDGNIPPELNCFVTPANCVPEAEVPEPSAALLLGAGAGLLGLVTRRRRSGAR